MAEDRAASSSARTEESDPARGGAGLRLVLVDDDPNDRALLARELRRSFPEAAVTEVANERGLATIVDEGDFDVLITDYKMGWTDGLAVLRRVKTAHPDRPVIMYTGTGNEQVAVEALKAGLDDYIIKSPDKLLRVSFAIRAARERIEQRRLLAAEQERFRTLIEKSGDLLMIIDGQGIIRFAGPSTSRVIGWEPRDIVGKVGTDLVHPEDVQIAARSFASIAQRPGATVVLSSRMRHSDGRWRWVQGAVTNLLDDPNVQGVVANFMDVTDVRLAEAALRASEDRYRTIVETALEGIWLTDADYKTSFVNTALLEMLGYDANEVIGKPLFLFLSEEWAGHAARDMARPQPGERFRLEVQMKRKDGSLLDVAMSANPIFDPSHQYVGSLAMVSDISAKVATARLREEMLDVISHEFRTPVTVISGYAQLLASGVWKPGAKNYEDARDRIEKAAKHLSYLLSTINELAMLREGMMNIRKETLSTRALLEEAILAVEARARGPPRKVTLQVQAGAEHLRTDARKLVMVVVELLDNAAKFSNPGSTVRIQARREAGAIWIELENEGQPFPERMRKALAEPFRQGDMSSVRRVGGAGLGLSLVNGLVVAMGGSMAYESPSPGVTRVGVRFADVEPAPNGAR